MSGKAIRYKCVLGIGRDRYFCFLLLWLDFGVFIYLFLGGGTAGLALSSVIL